MDSPIPGVNGPVAPYLIPRPVFAAFIWIFYGIAIIAAIGRTIVRLHVRQSFHLDDFLLAFACLGFTGATILAFLILDDIYVLQALAMDPLSVTITSNVINEVVFFQKVWYAYACVAWTVIFAVKFAFLHFFRTLVDRLPRMILYWRIVLGITIAVFAFCVSEPFIICNRFGISALHCLTPRAIRKQLLLSILMICLDISTEILIVSIPLSLLWRVKWSTRQKLGVGAFLTLNICVAIMCIVRVSATEERGSTNPTWGLFWQQAEASVAITMLSLTAFRSLFGSERFSTHQESLKPRHRPTMERIQYGKERVSQRNHDSKSLPTIRSATATGMRTFFWDATPTGTQVSEECSDPSSVLSNSATKHTGMV